MILIGMVKHSQSSQNSKFAMSLQYLKQEVGDEVNFRMKINIKVDFNFSDIKGFYLLMGILKHFQSTQGSKSTICLQYLEKEVKD